MTTQPDPATATSATAGPRAASTATWVRKATGSLKRYRVMAWVTGVMLLVLCVEMVLKYVVHAPESVMGALEWIPFAHGWIYVVYLVTVFDLWSTLRWKLGRLVTMALAGVVPVMSFVLERRVHAQAQARIDAAASARPAAPGAAA
ncbi:DUF3817 domain-containing protein [Cellulomonas sp. JZ18]|uniref:DUF3817 domain-containing protein n=1 Tax=Cellulomonas sp. JZ18 TaxID=2654191 RepID=UPI0012D47429|nr:DUF3817 domain-containing protein [Cellulomonas sp. JZ18]QGQ18730.1 DUF3817 domain-containing protein [Cellulomonas sp. JZ18]